MASVCEGLEPVIAATAFCAPSNAAWASEDNLNEPSAVAFVKASTASFIRLAAT